MSTARWWRNSSRSGSAFLPIVSRHRAAAHSARVQIEIRFIPVVIAGTIINAAGILLGGILGFTLQHQLSAARQNAMKGLLGVLMIFFGLKATWTHLGGGVWLVLKQLTIIVLALTFGRLAGRLLHLQKTANKLGRTANETFTRIATGGPSAKPKWNEGFLTCTILYCAAPLAVLGAVQDGLDGYWATLALKAVIDGLATMAFVTVFGSSAMAAVIPVVALQGTITMAAQYLAANTLNNAMLASTHATAGLLVFCVAMLILDLRKIEVTDYLPALAVAPLITWVWK